MSDKRSEATWVFFAPTYRRLFNSLILTASALSVVLTYTTKANAIEFRVVAIEGQQAPGTPEGTSFFSFKRLFEDQDAPTLNNAGQVAFTARLGGDGVDEFNQDGIWSEGSGSLSLIAREGSSAPGTTDHFTAFSLPTINDNGHVAFSGGIPSHRHGPRDGVWSGTAGSVSRVAGGDDAASGGPDGGVLDYISEERLFNSAGQTVFTSEIRCPADGGGFSQCGTGVFSDRSGSVAMVAGMGMSAPGLSPDITFENAGAGSLNQNGQTTISGTIEGPGVIHTNNQGIWSEGSGSLQLLAREGDVAPGTSPGVTFSDFRTGVINDSGSVTFRGELAGTGVDTTNKMGIWSDRSGNLSLVVRSGSPAPSTGLDFIHFEPAVMNNANQLAFKSRLAGPDVDHLNDDALWIEDGEGGLTMLVREGDSVPGMASNFAFKHISNPHINSVGQVAFVASTHDPSISRAPISTSLWIADPNGSLKMLFSVGEVEINNQVEVMPGDIRSLRSFQLSPESGQSDGRPSAFNDLGQIALRAGFSGGLEGVLVVSSLAVPEPTTFALAFALVTSCLLTIRHRGRASR